MRADVLPAEACGVAREEAEATRDLSGFDSKGGRDVESVESEVSIGWGEGGGSDDFRLFLAILCLPAGVEPGGDGETGGLIGPLDGGGKRLAEDGVDQAGGGTLAGTFDEFDTFDNGGVRGDAGKVEELVEADAEGDADFGVKAGFGSAEVDEVVELGLVAEGSEDDLGGETGVAGVEGCGGGAEEVGGPGAGVDAKEDIEGGAAGRRDGGQPSLGCEERRSCQPGRTSRRRTAQRMSVFRRNHP